ncbi:MAG: 2-isopropylmalate synthase, partial [uncultured Ramlibacter sp.]
GRPTDHLRHHLARRRAIARRLHDQGREAADRPPARTTQGGRDRGRLCRQLQRRFRGRAGHRQCDQGFDRLLALPGQRPRHRTRGRGAQRRQSRPHPHLHRHLAAAHGKEAAHDARPGARAGAAVGAVRTQPLRGHRVLARGRLSQRDGFPVPGARSRDRRRRDHHQRARHRRLRGPGALRQLHQDAARAHPELGQGDLVGALPQRPGHGGGQLPGRRQDRRSAPGRMHDQRPGRTGGQLLAGRDRHGRAHPQGLLRA